MNNFINKKNEQFLILINNLKILYNDQDKSYNINCQIIYNYLTKLNIEYDNSDFINIIKKLDYNFYTIYLSIINKIYENNHTNNLHSIFDDYEGNNIWNENTFFYNSIHSLLSDYDDIIVE